MKLTLPDFRKNYKSIIGVILLAFILWFMVKMNKVYEYSIDVPIEFVNLDQDKIFKYPYSTQAHVEFLGKGLDLLRLKYFNVFYQIDLAGSPDYLEFDLSQHPEYVNYPRELEVTVKSILRPRNISIELDRKMQKKLPVEIGYELVEPPGIILVDVISEPDSVLVTGPTEYFSKVKSIKTEQKKFEEPATTFSDIFRISETPEYFTQYDPMQVTVVFDLQRLAEKEVLNVPVTIINKPADLQVIPLPSTASIYIKGGEKLLADLGMQDFEIVIDFKKVWSPGVQRVKADLKTDVEVLYMETRPPVFELIVQKKRSN